MNHALVFLMRNGFVLGVFLNTTLSLLPFYPPTFDALYSSFELAISEQTQDEYSQNVPILPQEVLTVDDGHDHQICLFLHLPEASPIVSDHMIRNRTFVLETYRFDPENIPPPPRVA